ncbi:MAG: hypothetical protein M3P23_06230, partial [Actinomycetota bacterium]|nr:hypothetical protein [Actinomycetota bacterium]
MGTSDQNAPSPAAKAQPDVAERLRRDLTDATSQLAATNEILMALGRSGRDPGAALDTIIESARGLCQA